MNVESSESEQFMHIGVAEALKSGKVGFEEISEQATSELFNKSPEGQKFIVPDERYVTVYKDRAKRLDRKDLNFEVQTEE